MWAHQKCQHFTSTTLDFYIPFPPWWLTCVPSRLSGLQICSPIAPPEANERLVHLNNHRFFYKKTNHYVNQTFTIVCSMVIFRDVSNGLNWHCWSFNIFPLGEPSTCEAVRYISCKRPQKYMLPVVGFQGMCLGNHKDKYEIHKNRVHIYICVCKYIQCIFINIYIYTTTSGNHG